MPLESEPTRAVFAVCAVMTQHPLFDDILSALQERFGNIRHRGPVYPFDYTNYYASEMGENLHKQLLAFDKLRDPHELPELKRHTIEIERCWATEIDSRFHRRANIDPGLLSESTLVLATTKYSGHRISIAPGLFAEITLMFEGARYQTQPWTYADYQSEEMAAFLLQVRADLLGRRRSRPTGPPKV